MDDATQRTIARNEHLFREVNEAIERGLWPGEEGQLIPFRCECARLDCSGVVPLTVGSYEQVRAHPRWFLMLEGHQLPEAETVVERRSGYLVVEKRAAAGAFAEAADRRT